jgi:hypothetical protein
MSFRANLTPFCGGAFPRESAADFTAYTGRKWATCDDRPAPTTTRFVSIATSQARKKKRAESNSARMEGSASREINFRADAVES